jgi:hypothetical protein
LAAASTIGKIAKEIEEWADQKIPELVPGPKLAVMVSLDRLVGSHLDELITSLRVNGATECAKIVKEDYEKLKEAAKKATLDLVERIVEFKIDKLNEQHNGVSASDILNPYFKMPTDKAWKDREIPRTVYFDECAQCARQLAQTLRQVVAKAEATDELSSRTSFVKRIPRWIYYLLASFAALLTILHLLGWLEGIRRLFKR